MQQAMVNLFPTWRAAPTLMARDGGRRVGRQPATVVTIASPAPGTVVANARRSPYRTGRMPARCGLVEVPPTVHDVAPAAATNSWYYSFVQYRRHVANGVRPRRSTDSMNSSPRRLSRSD